MVYEGQICSFEIILKKNKWFKICESNIQMKINQNQDTPQIIYNILEFEEGFFNN